MENRHTYRRLRNKIGQRPNNRPILGIKQKIGKLGNVSTDALNNIDTDKLRSQNKAKLVGDGTNCCGSDKPNTDIGISRIKQTKKTNKSTAIKRKLTCNKINSGAKAFEREEANVNLPEETIGFISRGKSISDKLPCTNNLKESLTDDDVTNDEERMFNIKIKNIGIGEARDSIETEISSMISANSRKSGEVFLSDGIVSWKK